MSIEYIGEKIFLEEVEANGQVWVARSDYNSIYAMEFDKSGFSLPVWSSRRKAEIFLQNSYLIGPKYEPHPVPLDVFTNAWLSDKARGVSELQINPNGRETRVLALTVEEFQKSQAH